MRKILGIARYTFIEIFRNKVYYVLLLFAGVILGSSLLLGALGGEQRQRMIIDMGLVSIETFAMIVSVFAAVTLVLEEMESRTLYLILTRPVARYEFIVGRFVGLISLVTLTILAMAAGHGGVSGLQHIPPTLHYAVSLFYIWEKIVLITSVAVFFSLFSTSTISAVTFTFFFWVIGHFSAEILFLGNRSGSSLLKALCGVFYYIAPNFQLMNLRDIAPGVGPGRSALAWATAYGGFYTLTCLALSVLLFRKKEF